MDLKPVDIVHKRFGRRVRGLDPAEVDEFLKSVADELEVSLAENAELRKRIESLEGDLRWYKDTEATLNGALVLAQKTTEEITANAHKEAELIVREAREGAQADVQDVRRELEDLRKAKERFALEFRVLLMSCLETCERSQVDGRSDQPAE